MEIISHRGLWKLDQDKNSPKAFQDSFAEGFGTETDIRDFMGDLVISHDPPKSTQVTFRSFLKLAVPTGPLLALNIKSDGLSNLLASELHHASYTNYVVFDMSGPELFRYVRLGHPVLARWSEYEEPRRQLELASGVWLDSMVSDSWRIDWLKANPNFQKRIFIPSPELHGRQRLEFWGWLRSDGFAKRPNLVLCTDYPYEAREFFKSGAY